MPFNFMKQKQTWKSDYSKVTLFFLVWSSINFPSVFYMHYWLCDLTGGLIFGEQHWGLVWSLLSCKWGVLFGSPLIGSVGEQWFGNRKSSEMVGSRRRSSAVGSRRSIKEGHLSCYYTLVKRELICVNEEVNPDMWDCPLHSAHGQSKKVKTF